MIPARRGSCPSVSLPMSTGDGLLARVMPSSPISLDAFAALCESSQTYGNGIMEVTQRGSLQIRGLTPASAPAFARAVAALGLADEGMPPVLTSPLLGLDPGERVDLRALAQDLLRALRHRVDVASVGPKVSVLIDGGGRLHMDEVTADLRLRAGNGPAIQLSIAGSAQNSTSLGWMDPQHAIEAIIRVLAAIGHRGSDARAKDFTNADDAQALRLSLADILAAAPASAPAPAPAIRPRAEPIGTHRLNNGMIARGFALPFGYIEAGTLRRLTLTAAHCGAASIRPAAGRVLLIIGLPISAMEELVAAAAREKLIVQPDDARRHVVACAGAPACNSAMLSTRQLAAQVAEAAGPILDGSITIHLSGCAKGCAHPGAAGLTLAGPDRLVVHGHASDAPQARISPADFIAGLRSLHPERDGSLADLLRDPRFVSRLSKGRPLEPAHGELGRD